MATLDPLLAGSVVAEKYLVERELGRGGMGVVLAAKHVTLGVRVALKVLTVSTDAPGAVARFLREARATASLRSEYVARVADYGTLPDGRPFMVLEYLEGDDLGVLLERGLAAQDVVDAVCQACAGLAEAHATGIVHRDLKPSNLFRTRRPDGSACTKVLDFGISKLLGATPESQLVSTETSAVLGTPLYMSPEQVRSTRDAEARSDIWSLGVVLAEALAGEPPFTGQTLGEVFSRILEASPAFPSSHRNVQPELQGVVMRCLAKRPEDRFASVAELAGALAPFASVEGREAARRARDTAAASAGSVGAGDTIGLAPPQPAHATMAETLDAIGVGPPTQARRAETAPVGATTVPRQASPRSRGWVFVAAGAAAGAGILAYVSFRAPSHPGGGPSIVVDSATPGATPTAAPLVAAVGAASSTPVAGPSSAASAPAPSSGPAGRVARPPPGAASTPIVPRAPPPAAGASPSAAKSSRPTLD